MFFSVLSTENSAIFCLLSEKETLRSNIFPLLFLFPLFRVTLLLFPSKFSPFCSYLSTSEEFISFLVFILQKLRLFYFGCSIFKLFNFSLWIRTFWKLSYFYLVNLYFLLNIKLATFAILYNPLLSKSLAKVLGFDVLLLPVWSNLFEGSNLLEDSSF